MFYYEVGKEKLRRIKKSEKVRFIKEVGLPVLLTRDRYEGIAQCMHLYQNIYASEMITVRLAGLCYNFITALLSQE